MTSIPPTSVTLEPGWEDNSHGAAPWINNANAEASYLEGSAFFVFRADWANVPALPGDLLVFDIQARIEGTAELRGSRTYEATAGFPVPGTSFDLDLYDGVWAEGGWQRGEFSTFPFVHAGGPLTLWFRTSDDGGLWSQDISYIGIVGESSPPYRRNFPRDDALAGGAGRNYPPSKAIQSGNRTSGGYL